MIKKILSIGVIFSLVYISLYTNIIESIFDCSPVAIQGSLLQSLLLATIASILIIKK